MAVRNVQERLEAVSARVQKKMDELKNPAWNVPPSVRPHDFCADYYHDWVMCYAIGSLNASTEDFDDVNDGKLVSSDLNICT